MTAIIRDQQNFFRYVTILGGKQENFLYATTSLTSALLKYRTTTVDDKGGNNENIKTFKKPGGNIKKHEWEYSGWKLSDGGFTRGSLIGGNYPGVISGVGVFMIPAKRCVTPSASTDLPRKLYNFSREM